jgi:hypothetical protein
MKTRLAIALSFCVASVATLYPVFHWSLSPEMSGVLANLGTGFIGTAFTVLIVDVLYERRSSRDECRRIALSILMDLDHAIWVWQGGSRSFNIDELSAYINESYIDDPIPFYTQNLFMRLGTKCATNVNLKSQELDRDPYLVEALRQLSKLERIRDHHFEFDEFKSILQLSIAPLATACGLQKPQPFEIFHPAHRPTSLNHQSYRHFGKFADGTEQPLFYNFDAPRS